MKEFLIYKGLWKEYKQWKKETHPPKNRREYHKKRYLGKKLEAFQKINNP